MTKVRGARLELFVISLVTLLLACILGISVGCLAANWKRDLLKPDATLVRLKPDATS